MQVAAGAYGFSWRTGGACPLTPAAADQRVLQNALTSNLVRPAPDIAGFQSDGTASNSESAVPTVQRMKNVATGFLNTFQSKFRPTVDLKQPACEADSAVVGQHIALELVPFVITGRQQPTKGNAGVLFDCPVTALHDIPSLLTSVTLQNICNWLDLPSPWPYFWLAPPGLARQ